MVSISRVSKKYRDIVLHDINFTINAGNICCLLGKNGAGKSTLINIISGITRPDKGEVIINGRMLRPNSIFEKGEIGIVGQYDNIINQLTGHQFLVFQCLIYDLPKSIMDERIRSLTEYFFEDSSDLHKSASSYSSGMRMKLRIIASLLNNPNILVLDEPFSNLDPIAADKLIELLKKFGEKENSIVFISSHDLMYVDKIATQICVINDKKIVFNGSKDSFTNNNTIKIDKTLLDLIKTDNASAEKLSWMI